MTTALEVDLVDIRCVAEDLTREEILLVIWEKKSNVTSGVQKGAVKRIKWASARIDSHTNTARNVPEHIVRNNVFI